MIWSLLMLQAPLSTDGFISTDRQLLGRALAECVQREAIDYVLEAREPVDVAIEAAWGKCDKEDEALQRSYLEMARGPAARLSTLESMLLMSEFRRGISAKVASQILDVYRRRKMP